MVTPRLVLDLETVRERYRRLTAAFPGSEVLYAVKANPHPAVLTTLAGLGSGFDVASPEEVKLVLAEGVPPSKLSYGNPIRKKADAAQAFALGVRTFVTDSLEDLAVLADVASESTVFVRIAVDDTGSATPFHGKFGCSPAMASAMLSRVGRVGLVAGGVSFHAGSQQVDPLAWARAIATVAQTWEATPAVNLGGGLPVEYASPVPPPEAFASALGVALRRHFPRHSPALAIEPGRYIVAEAGVMHAEVVRVSWRDDGRRWIYIDVGRYSGLAETENESIRYRIVGPRGDGPVGPAVLAGPTCDGDDVLYRQIDLPLDLRAGDLVRIEAAGAYTASYASIGFNGFGPPSVVSSTGGAR